MPCRNTFLKYPVIICIFLSTEHLHTQCQFNTTICLYAWWHISNSPAAILIYLTSENSTSKIFTLANCKSVKCSAHLGNYLLLSLIASPTHLALWLNRVEPTGNFPFLERIWSKQSVLMNSPSLPATVLDGLTDSSQQMQVKVTSTDWPRTEDCPIQRHLPYFSLCLNTSKVSVHSYILTYTFL